MSANTPPPATKPPPAKKKDPGTVVFGEALESRNYLRTPKAFIHIRSFDHPLAKKLKARHIHLILVLAAKKYKKNMIRRYWARLAQDLGVSTETTRKWAYELRDAGLIKIIPFTGKLKLPAPKGKPGMTPGFRNEANGFDLTPLIDLITQAAAARKAARAAKAEKITGGLTK